MDNLIELLKTNPLFTGLSEEELTSLIDSDGCRIENYKKDSIIAQEREICQAIGIVIKGSLSVSELAPSGISLMVQILSSGDCFGVALVFAKKHAYPFSVISFASSSILFVSFGIMKQLVETNKQFNINLISFLSDNTVHCQNKVHILLQKEVRSRLILYLANECRNLGCLSFVLPHTKTEIAELLAVARPSIPRELSRMQHDKLIKIEGKTVTILKTEYFDI